MLGTSPFNFSSSITSSTFNQGNAGNITVNTSKLFLQDNSGISSSSFAFGDAGTILINASRFVDLSGASFIEADVSVSNEILQELFTLPDTPTANAKELTINTRELKLRDKAQIAVSNSGLGDAGTLNLNVDRLILDNNASISATSTSGLGGTIAISGYTPNTPSSIISLSNSSAIETNKSTTTDPNRGTIDIFTRDLHLNNGSITLFCHSR